MKDDMIASMKHDFRIARVTQEDTKGLSDHLRALQDLIAANEPMYPGINKWLRSKVLPGLRADERVAYVGYLNEQPAVSAVVKRGKDAKFCHLRIREDLQDNSIGDVFFSLMASSVKGLASEIHFTLPESLWAQKVDFFRSFRFTEVVKASAQYRKGDEELRSSARASEVLKAVAEKRHKLIKRFSEFGHSFTLDGYSFGEGILMSVHPKFAAKIMKGEKRVEIRGKFSKKWIGTTVKIYSTSPEQSLVGEATIGAVIAGTPSDIWEKFGPDIGCSKKVYDEYTASQKEVSAIVLSEIRPYREIVPISQLEHYLQVELRPPQSYYALEKNKRWAEAASLAVLLQNTFKHLRPIVI